MRLVVYGAGAVGGLVGGLLHRAGHDVTLIARGAHLEALQTTGLHLISPNLDEVLSVPAVAGPEDVDWRGDEVVLVAVKSDATAEVAARLSRVAPGVRVVSLQNGVANEPTLARWFAQVYAVCVMAPATHLWPGVVVAKSGGVPAILDVGRWPAGTDDTCDEIAKAFTDAGIVSEPRADLMAWKYRKLLLNLGNAVDACCVDDDAAERLVDALRAEAETVLAATGVEVISEPDDRVRRGDLLRRGETPAPPGGSTWQSLARGTGSVETDYLNGEIVLTARRLGVPAPLNERVQRLAAAMAADGRPPRSVDAATLL